MRSAHEIYDKVGVDLQSLDLIGGKSVELEKIRKVYRNIHKDDLDVMPRRVFIGVEQLEPIILFSTVLKTF